MSARKAERLMNLFIVLLVKSSYVPKSAIRGYIPDYANATSDEAFEKMFERDKEELRAIGIPIQMGSHEDLFGDEQGYRIPRDAYELADISLTPEEVAVLGLAARVWQHAGLAESTADAVLKIQAAGGPVDMAALDTLQLSLPTVEPAFDPLLKATQQRQPVTFEYRRPGASTSERRSLHPWGVITSRGRWYVVGRDLDRDAPRMFRLSRIQGAVTTMGKPGDYEVPPGTDVRELSRELDPVRSDITVEVLARQGSAMGLRRWATTLDRPAPEGWDRLIITASSLHQITSTLLGYGDAVEVVAPAEVRTAVLERLEALTSAQAGI